MKRCVILMVCACLAWPAAAVEADSSDADRQILGVWKLQFTTPDGVHRTPTVIVGRQYQEYVAWYIGDDKPEPFQDVQLRGDTLVGSIRPQERPDITVTLESRLQGDDQCVGTAKYRSQDGGDAGSWKFTGQRLALSSFDEVMTWKLRFVTPDHAQHAPTVTVVSQNGKFYAWYSGQDHELPARSMSVQGERVEMTISADSPEGTQVDVTFRGTVTGDKIQGTAEYRMPSDSGSFSFEGQRAS